MELINFVFSNLIKYGINEIKCLISIMSYVNNVETCIDYFIFLASECPVLKSVPHNFPIKIVNCRIGCTSSNCSN